MSRHVTKQERQFANTGVRRQPRHHGKRGNKAHTPKVQYNRHDKSWRMEVTA